jgi:hypothetical protein
VGAKGFDFVFPLKSEVGRLLSRAGDFARNLPRDIEETSEFPNILESSIPFSQSLANGI